MTEEQFNAAGGPAFPRPGFSPSFPYSGGEHSGEKGMSLRDWFAGMAMQGLLAAIEPPATLKCNEAAKAAYQIADAMLSERERNFEIREVPPAS